MTVPNDRAAIAEARVGRDRQFHFAMTARRAELVIPTIPRRTRVVYIDGHWTKTRRKFEHVLAIARGLLIAERVTID